MLSLRIDLKGSSEMIGGAPNNGGGDEAAEGGGVDAANGGGGDCNMELDTHSHPSARPRHPQAEALVHEEGAFADGGRRALLVISDELSSSGSSSAGGGTKVTRRADAIRRPCGARKQMEGKSSKTSHVSQHCRSPANTD